MAEGQFAGHPRAWYRRPSCRGLRARGSADGTDAGIRYELGWSPPRPRKKEGSTSTGLAWRLAPEGDCRRQDFAERGAVGSTPPWHQLTLPRTRRRLTPVASRRARWRWGEGSPVIRPRSGERQGRWTLGSSIRKASCAVFLLCLRRPAGEGGRHPEISARRPSVHIGSL